MWFPFTHFFFFFLFMSSLASCLFTSLLSFSCAHNGPGLSLYAHIHCTLRSQVAQVLKMRFGSLFVPVHLVPSSSQPPTPLSCLVLFSCLHLFVLGCVHLCTHVFTLVFASPRGGVCVRHLKTQGSLWNELPVFLPYSFVSRGAVGILEVTAQRRHFKFALICNPDADCTYLRKDDHHSFPFGPPLSLEQDFQPSHLFASAVTHLF